MNVLGAVIGIPVLLISMLLLAAAWFVLSMVCMFVCFILFAYEGAVSLGIIIVVIFTIMPSAIEGVQNPGYRLWKRFFKGSKDRWDKMNDIANPIGLVAEIFLPSGPLNDCFGTVAAIIAAKRKFINLVGEGKWRI